MQKKEEAAGKMPDVERKAREILVQTKALQTYNTAELRVLLTYYQVKGLSGMKKDAIAAKWREILDSQKDANAGATDERNLAKLISMPITLADTALGRHEQTIKRQVKYVVTKMLREERKESRKKLEEMNEMEGRALTINFVMPNLACEMSPSKADDQTTQDNTETNHNEGI